MGGGADFQLGRGGDFARPLNRLLESVENDAIERLFARADDRGIEGSGGIRRI